MLSIIDGFLVQMMIPRLELVLVCEIVTSLNIIPSHHSRRKIRLPALSNDAGKLTILEEEMIIFHEICTGGRCKDISSYTAKEHLIILLGRKHQHTLLSCRGNGS